MNQPVRKKLIEVALPLDTINKESLHRKQKAPKGWPTSFHKWWAQRPLAAARAVIFAQMVDDPSANPDLFPTDGKPPVNPHTRSEKSLDPRQWRRAQGLAEDVRYYGRWMRDEAEKRIGHLYPQMEITPDMAEERSDLKPLVGRKLTVIAWLWARTVRSPNPAFAEVDVPLASSFMLSTKSGKEAYVEPVIERGGYRFVVKVGKPQDAEAAKNGTKHLRGSNFRCLLSGSAIDAKYIRSEVQAGRMGARLMAVVAEGDRRRVYLSPQAEMEVVARSASSAWKPDLKVPTPCHDVDRLPMYGMPTWGDAFTPRQLVSLTTFSDLVTEARECVQRDAGVAGLADDGKPLAGGGGASAYADAVCTYLACVLDRMVYYGSNLTSWLPKDNALRDCMPRQALAMTWDFAEANPLGKSSGDVLTC